MQFPYITTHYLDLVPILDNTYTIDAREFNLSKPCVPIEIDGIHYENTFAILIKNDPDTSSVCSICSLIHKDEDFVSFRVVDRGYVKNLEFDILTAERYSYQTLPEDLVLTIQRLFSRLSLVYKSIKFKDLNANMQNLNKVAASIITDNFDLLSYHEATDVRAAFYIFYEYYSLLLEIKTSTLFHEDLTETQEENFPDYVKHKISSEQKLLAKHSNTNQESIKIEEYLELVKRLPWGEYTTNNKDISVIQEELNNSHYGLKEVKDKILDSIAFEKYTNKATSDYLLFSGPPGTGKTSIAKSIAKILNRDYIYISMAGMNDETEIRGHRRTYIGSKPGRIIEKLSKIKTLNPVIVLDEIDKITTVRTNPEYALLELLDPEQNSEFFDRYLELPIDLSKCIFICTCNNHKLLSSPLLDRLQLINFRAYSTAEKKEILLNYLLPTLVDKYNISSLLSFSDDFIEFLTKEYSLRDIKATLLSVAKRNSKLSSLNLPLIEDLSSYNLNFNFIKKEKSIGFK